ncbi:MAG: ABC transporter substrate-binding protein [Propionibacteriaceae bacterium]|jgi:glucose/mannose transport system substrate-binding protein|nr:ABC transporter substrate-binding protein [Propionibacteriaceae bacterium]
MRPRKIIAALAGAALVLSMAACTKDPVVDPTGDPGAATGQLEIFSWWTAGSEALGLAELVKVLNDKYPDITFVNNGASTGGGSGKDVLQTRMAAGQPPDSFQVHAGAEAQDYITAKQLEDVSYLYSEFKLNDVFPTDLVDMLTKDGKIYTIPSNVHRSNVVWASIAALEKAGLSTTDAYYDSIDSFIAALDKAKAAGIEFPLAIGTTWCQVHLLETVLMADLTPAQYRGLFDGTTDWRGAEVKKALDHFAKLMSYTNADRGDLDWEPALVKVLDANAVFTVMGDWTPAALDARNLKEGVDWLWAPSPGTKGIYGFLADSFGLTTGGPNPAAGKAWLDVISSKEGQTGFNQVKGSIPARTDIDLSTWSNYQQGASESFKNDAIVPSIQHGAAATIAQGNDTGAAVSKFTVSPMAEANIATLQEELAKAYA